MFALPATTNATALWASTPLLAAAQLWSWHPLWAASIWSMYGFGALLMAESPRNSKLDSPMRPLGSVALQNSAPRTTWHLETTIITISPTVPTFGLEPTIHIAEYTKLFTQIVNATRLDSPSATIHLNRVTSNGPIITPKASSPLATHLLDMVDPRIPSPELQEDRDQHRPSSSVNNDNWTIFVFVAKQTVKFAACIGMTLTMLWPVLCRVWHILLDLHIAQHIQIWYHTLVEALLHGYTIGALRLQQSYHNIAEHVQNFHLDYQNLPLPVLWAANLTWGAQNPYLRVAVAGGIWLALAILAGLVAWPLAGWTSHLLHATFSSVWSVVVVPWPTPYGFPGLHLSEWVSSLILSNPFSRTWTCISQVPSCIAAAFSNHIFSDGTYTPAHSPIHCTAAICESIEEAIMVIRMSFMGAIWRCFAAAWNTQHNAAGGYLSALQYGPTKSLCENIQVMVMDVKTVGRDIRLFFSCLPLLASVLSTKTCPLWALFVSRFTLVSLLTTCFFVNIYAPQAWPAVPPQSPFLRAGRIITTTLLWLTPFLFIMAVLPSRSDLVVGSANITVAYCTAWYLEGLLVPRWNAVLRWCRIAPLGNY